MIYINYYSKVRNRIGMTEEELNREIAFNKNRIATKTVPHSTHMRIDQKALMAAVKVQEAIEQFVAYHPQDVKRTAFVDDRFYQDYFYDFSSMYRTFQIPKRRGGFREICAPTDELKSLQTQVATLFTKSMKFLPHNAAHGFTRKRNCKTSLEVHQKYGARWFLKLDIKDFFPNTTFSQIVDAMKHVYPFCCLTERQMWLFASVCTLGGVTPQGAPTSPVITNLVMVTEDVRITEYCKAHKLTYTRYADDILISSKVSFDWETVQRDIQAILENYELKTEKTRYGSFNGRNWNLGLMYNNQNQITVGHAKKKLVKNLVHNYLTKPEQQTQENFYHLIGLIGYCRYVEPAYFENYLEQIKAHAPA